ncbi:MAG: CARDB domain-containing protein, partial [Cyanobacteria bacterium P01_A01_bin.83]
MSLPDLYGTFYPGFAPEYLERGSREYFFYKGETINGNLVIGNSGTEGVKNFDVDLYISTDKSIDTNDYFLGNYNFANGIEGKNEDSILGRDTYAQIQTSVTLPNVDSAFWLDQDIYYVGAVIDPDNEVAESNENNNFENPNDDSDSYWQFGSYSSPIYIEESDLPVISFTLDEGILNINLSEPAPESGFTVNYRNIAREDYFNNPDNFLKDYYMYNHRNIGSRFYDPEFDRLYITKQNYYDLTDYKYYDTNGGYYNPVEDKYFNADGSYYDVGKKLFYDPDGKVTELIDNSAEYTDSSSSPRHYLATGGYVSLISGIYYDANGGYINKTTEEYFRGEGENGLGNSPVNIDYLTTRAGTFEFGFGFLPLIATPDVDYEIIPGENIAEITDTAITIAPGETTATIDFEFLSDSIFDPNETIEFELLANDQKYLVGRSSLYRDFAPELDLEDLQNPALGNYNFSVAQNAIPGTVVGRVNLSHPQGNELTYSLVNGQPRSDFDESFNNYSNVSYSNVDLVITSNQDLDGDGIYPFSIDSATGVITLSDFDDLDREASNNIDSKNQPQLYNSGYYQLLVRTTDKIIAEDLYPAGLYPADEIETSLVNIKVLDTSITPENDNIQGLSTSKDHLDGLAGDDTIKGLAGDDTLIGNEGDDRLIGGIGDDQLNGGAGNDSLFGNNGNDTLNGGAGDDLLRGQSGNDVLNGGAGNDTLLGGNYFDRLYGGAGDDLLDGV